MDKTYIDINCDMGEGVGNEEDLIPLISSCNIACGGHAGNSDMMLKVARWAKKQGVKVGAHPSYPDRKNFGRNTMNISEAKLFESIRMQVNNFNTLLQKENIKLHHIKPHGALYNDLAKSLHLSTVFLKAIQDFKNDVFLYIPFNSTIKKEAIEQGFKLKYEAFADRNYNSDVSLVSRKLPDALIEDPKEVLEHILSMAIEGKVRTVSGKIVPIVADTFCIHGDTATALQILSYLSDKLPKHHIQIEK